MKKLVFLAVILAFAWASPGAALEKFAVLRLADTAALTNAAAKLGALVGVDALGPAAAATLSQTELFSLFGSGRTKAPSAYVLYLPVGDATLAATNLGERVQTAALYPAGLSRAEFLSRNKAATAVTNGLARIVSGFEDAPSTNYVAFASDGRWVSYSPSAALAAAALAETSTVEKADLEDNVIDFSAAGRAWKRLLALCAQAPEEAKALDGLGAAQIGWRVNDAGLDVRGTLAIAAGSPLGTLAEQTQLSGEPLSFADKNSLWAFESVLSDVPGARTASFKDVARFFGENGFKLDALTVEETNGAVFVSLDLPRLISDNKSNDWAVVSRRLLSDPGCLTNVRAHAAASAGVSRVAFTLKGAKGLFTPAQRFAAVLPEAKGRPLCTAYAGSLYGTAKIAVAQYARAVGTGDEAAHVIGMMLAALPAARQGGTAGAVWRDGDGLRFHYRLSASELKGFAAVAQLGMGLLAADSGEEEDMYFEEEEVEPAEDGAPDEPDEN